MSRSQPAEPRAIDVGLEHHRAGRIAEAEAVYRRLLSDHPDDHDALHLLGVCAIQRNRLDDAVELISRSLAINPSNVRALSHLGEALRGLGHLDEAAACLEKALRLNDRLFEAHNSLGNVYQALRQPGLAIACYRKAIEINPEYAEAHTNLGNILSERADFDAAIACYRRALAIRPDFAEASYNLGTAFRTLGNNMEAIPLYRKTVSLSPGHFHAHLALARCHQEIGEREEALAAFERASALDPRNPEPRWGAVMTQIAQVAESTAAVAEQRTAFAADLADLDAWFDASRVGVGFDAIGTQLPFYLAYHEQNNRDLLSRYGSLCTRLAAHWQDTHALKVRKRAAGRKIRIGLASAHICRHSIWSALTKGWVEQLDDRRFELHVFSLGTGNDPETEIARSRAANFVQGLATPRKWAEEILARSLDILIYAEVGMESLTAKLPACRLAPIQATTWGHPETSGLPSIDYYLSGESLEPDRAQDHYSERLVLLPNLSSWHRAGNVEPVDLSLSEYGVDDGQTVFVCPGTPFKYAPQHDWIYPAIARKLGRCQFVFFRYSNENLVRLLMQRIDASFASAGLRSRDYVVELPWLDRGHFFGVMRRAHAYLDTIGFSGFNTALQAIECGLPIVTRDGRFLRGRLASGILKRMGLRECVVASDEAYVELAVHVARDQKFRDGIRHRIERSRHVLYEDPAPIRALEDFLENAARANS